jgi:hypothetical protein
MKRNIFYLLFVTVLIASCKKPEACITASPTTAKIGQPIIFTDCSVDAKVSKIIPGDGTNEVVVNGTLSHTYTAAPGDYTATINLYNSHDKKKATANTTITIARPTTTELVGTWSLYKFEDVAFGISTSVTYSELWVFNSDGTYTVDNGSSKTWVLANNNLTADFTSYRITKLYNGDMILRFNEVSFFVTTYSQYYLVKQ